MSSTLIHSDMDLTFWEATANLKMMIEATNEI